MYSQQVAKPSKVNKILKAIHNALAGLHKALFNLVLTFFEELNKRIRARILLYFMEKETGEHVKTLIKMFKYVVLPLSLFYVLSDFFLFGENAVDSMLWGVLIFIYSSFLPDLPSICRKQRNNGTKKDLAWYKKYALLLFAPLFIWALFSGIRLKWETYETFHNFKSLTIYAGFLCALGFVFMYPPFTVADLAELVSVPLYGVIGYLSHLKVDRIL